MRQIIPNVQFFRDTATPGPDGNYGEFYMDDVNFTGVFKACYEQYREHDGKPVDLVRVIEKADDTHDQEVLPMFVVRLPDGEEIEAWPEEVTENVSLS